MSKKTDLPEVPPGLVDVALIDGPTIAAAGGMAISAWHELVRKGEAPQPVIRRPRFTRWRLVDIRAWLAALADSADAESDASLQLLAQAKKASAAARAKRCLVAGATPGAKS